MPRVTSWFFHPGAILTGWLKWLIAPGPVIGDEHVPREGAYLLVANHCSNLDPPFAGWAVGHRNGRVIHFMAKDEMRHWPLIGWLGAQAGAFYVRRGSADRAAQRRAVELLAEGRPIALFPEGTRSRTGVMGEPRAGAALLAMRADIPILPVGISGTHRIFPGRSRIPHRSRVTIRIGEPFRLPSRDDLDRAALREGSERIMRAIATLLPEEQRGRWG